MVTRRARIVGSCRSVQASWASILSVAAAVCAPGSPTRVMSATPSADTATETWTDSPGGRNDRATPRSPSPGPVSRLEISAEASCSPRGTNTGSGTRIRALGSKKYIEAGRNRCANQDVGTTRASGGLTMRYSPSSTVSWKVISPSPAESRPCQAPERSRRSAPVSGAVTVRPSPRSWTEPW